MGLNRSFLVLIAITVMIGLANAQDVQRETQDPAVLAGTAGEADASLSVPEPNTMLFAGIGGFILLLFAIRRK